MKPHHREEYLVKNRSEKAVLIEQIKEAAARASFAVVTDFKGMSVEELTGLRVALRAAGGEYHVVKNTLARIALADTDHSSVAPALKNNSAIALGFQDPVGVAKALSDFAKTNKKLEIRMGALDGKAMTAAQVDELAKLPSKEQLLAQALATMNAVPTNFVSLMANMVRPLLYALKALEEKKAA